MSTNIHSTSTPFQSNVPCTVCTYPTARPMPRTCDAGRHMTYTANICQRHTSTPLLTRTSHLVAYFLDLEIARNRKLLNLGCTESVVVFLYPVP